MVDAYNWVFSICITIWASFIRSTIKIPVAGAHSRCIVKLTWTTRSTWFESNDRSWCKKYPVNEIFFSHQWPSDNRKQISGWNVFFSARRSLFKFGMHKRKKNEIRIVITKQNYIRSSIREASVGIYSSPFDQRNLLEAIVDVWH